MFSLALLSLIGICCDSRNSWRSAALVVQSIGGSELPPGDQSRAIFIKSTSTKMPREINERVAMRDGNTFCMEGK
jgi:hypothetical protein